LAWAGVNDGLCGHGDQSTTAAFHMKAPGLEPLGPQRVSRRPVRGPARIFLLALLI